MATTISYLGQVTALPDVYSTIDDRDLSSPSPQATGILGLIGPAIGGKPYTAITQRSDMRAYTSTAQLAADYPAGPLFEAANMAFAPSTDAAIPGGAQTIVALKANPSTQARLNLNSTDGASLRLTARAWGLSGNTIRVAVGPGTDGGTKLTLTQGSITEVGDDLGDDPVATLTYDTSAGWPTLKATMASYALSIDGTLQVPGRSGEVTATRLAQPAKLTITAAQADGGKTLTVYGAQADGTGVVEQIKLVSGSQQSVGTFAQVLGASLDDASLDVRVLDGANNLLVELKSNAEALGLADIAELAVGGMPISLQGSEANTTVVVRGLDTTGNDHSEAVALVVGQPVATHGAYTRITHLAVGGLAQPLTVTATAGRVQTAAGASLLMAQGALSAIDGLTFTITGGDEGTPLGSLDALPATELGASPVTLVSDLEAIVDWVNANSQLVTAEAITGATGVPQATQQPVQLVGGTESPATPADYQKCLDLFKLVRLNTVVALDPDPVVNKAVDAHCIAMNGKGHSERDAVVGIKDAALVDVPSLQQFLAGIGALNSRNVRAVGQAVQRYNTFLKVTDFGPEYLAALVAGMQCGSPLGTPLTRKSVDVLGVRQHRSWNPIDDADALVQAGACIFRAQDNLGVRMWRNVTTYTTDPNNLRCTEASVNEICNYIVYDLRNDLQAYVGQMNFAGTLSSIYARCVVKMGVYKNDMNIITAYKDPVVVGKGDTAQVAVGVSPTLPLNFILLNVNVALDTTQSAAA